MASYKLSLGIIGLPNVGKSTLFKLLTKQEVNIANYPFCTIDPNVGVVTVPDERLEVLTKLSQSKKTIPAIVEFYDIAGLVRGASQGEGLGNKFLSHIKEVQAIVHVVRIFPGDHITHVDQSIDPVRDIETIEGELALKDLEVVERRILKVEGEARTGKQVAQKELELLKRVQEKLGRGELVEEFAEEPAIKEMQLLMAKRQMFLLNGEESDLTEPLKKKIASLGAHFIVVNLHAAKDISQLIAAAYETLNLISFFTTGEDETRAWTIRRGAKAPEAAGAIHSDFETKFIRAEVVAYTDLVKSGGWNQAKQKGLLRVEGKEYEVKDGDVMVVRHG